MRVTLTLDDDVHRTIREEARRRGVTMGRLLSDVMRAGLEETGRTVVDTPPSPDLDDV